MFNPSERALRYKGLVGFVSLVHQFITVLRVGALVCDSIHSLLLSLSISNLWQKSTNSVFGYSAFGFES